MLKYLRWITITGYALGLPLFVYSITRIVQPGTGRLLTLSFVLISTGALSSLIYGWRTIKSLHRRKIFFTGNLLISLGLIGTYFPWQKIFPGIFLWLGGMFVTAIGICVASFAAFKQRQTLRQTPSK